MFMERLTNLKVYTLLMNIDYVPILNRYKFSAWVGFSFHLIICVILTFFLAFLALRLQWRSKEILLYTIIVNIVISVLYYPTTTLSDRTPPFLSWPSFMLWVFVHIVYGAMLGYLLVRSLKYDKRTTAY